MDNVQNHDGIVLTHYMWESFILHKVIWVAMLSNGLLVAQDDFRPDVYPEKAWDRLRIYLKAQRGSVKIEHFYVRYMDNVIDFCPHKADGYFYREAHGGIVGVSSWDMVSFGYVSNGTVYSRKYKKPELIHFESDVRSLQDVEDSTWLNV